MRGDDHLISVEFVDHVRRMGASDDLVEFTDRHAARYSRADIERTQSRWFLIGCVAASAVIAVVLRLAVG